MSCPYTKTNRLAGWSFVFPRVNYDSLKKEGLPVMYREIRRDLFKTDPSWVVAHCISADAALGAGIAKQFRNRFPKMSYEIATQNPSVPDIIRYVTPHWCVVYNLVTKRKYWQQPTRPNLNASLDLLIAQMRAHGETKLAIPMIGAGLDKLAWPATAKYLAQLADQFDLDIVVCKL